MTKTFLLVLGAVLALMGLWVLAAAMGWLPSVAGVMDQWWFALVEVVVGLAAVYVAYSEK